MSKPKRPPGRPPTPPEETLVARTIRLKPKHWAKIDANGMEWLRRGIERLRQMPKND